MLAPFAQHMGAKGLPFVVVKAEGAPPHVGSGILFAASTGSDGT